MIKTNIDVDKKIEKEKIETVETKVEDKNTNTNTTTNTNKSTNEKTYSIININNASVNDLITLPGIGDAIAKRVIDYRNKNGSYKTIDDIKKVSGIGDSKFNKIKKYIEV